MSKDSPLGKEIRTIRMSAGLTQATFAHVIGVEQATVSRWERGAEPTLENLRALAVFAQSAGLDVSEFKNLFHIIPDVLSETRNIPLVGSIVSPPHVILDPDFIRNPKNISKFKKIGDIQFPRNFSIAVKVDTRHYVPQFSRGSIIIFGIPFYSEPDSILDTHLGSLCMVDMGEQRPAGKPEHVLGYLWEDDYPYFGIVTKSDHAYFRFKPLWVRKALAILLP